MVRRGIAFDGDGLDGRGKLHRRIVGHLGRNQGPMGKTTTWIDMFDQCCCRYESRILPSVLAGHAEGSAPWRLNTISISSALLVRRSTYRGRHARRLLTCHDEAATSNR